MNVLPLSVSMLVLLASALKTTTCRSLQEANNHLNIILSIASSREGPLDAGSTGVIYVRAWTVGGRGSVQQGRQTPTLTEFPKLVLALEPE